MKYEFDSALKLITLVLDERSGGYIIKSVS